MGKNNTSLDDVKENIKGWADSKILDDKSKEVISGGRSIENSSNEKKKDIFKDKPNWGSLCGGCIPG